MAERADIRIGVSGWTYTPWRGNFYPTGLRQKDELSYAASQFNALEINGTFYGMQVPQSFARWAAAVPDDFVFAVKGPRFLTHMLKLTRIEAPLANFFASGPLALGHKLGPILWQFPERFGFDPDRLLPFFEMLPRTHSAAARLAARHDHRLRAAAHLEIVDDLPIRHAIEIRHAGFREPRFIDLLRRHNVALVCADTVDWPLLMDLTADFAYCRLHGSTELYKSRYSQAEIERWAGRVDAWANGRRMADGNFVTAPLDDGKRRDVYVFFDNTDKLQAPDNARELMQALDVAASAASIGAAA
ncbi:MAG TPA: DUF72 domain-containing protein [Devosia sp.]|jgi:uncharacterized protein YecE (DUF72 family)|nr:DUF72 domain-containing protein [Devosia sp.]